MATAKKKPRKHKRRGAVAARKERKRLCLSCGLERSIHHFDAAEQTGDCRTCVSAAHIAALRSRPDRDAVIAKLESRRDALLASFVKIDAEIVTLGGRTRLVPASMPTLTTPTIPTPAEQSQPRAALRSRRDPVIAEFEGRRNTLLASLVKIEAEIVTLGGGPSPTADRNNSDDPDS